MKHNRIRVILAILAAMVLLSGCLDVGDLSEEESDMIAEYSAGVLLRYSGDYDRRLITKEQAEKEGIEEEKASAAPLVSASPGVAATATADVPSAAPDASPGKEENPAAKVTLNQLYQMDGIDFSYDTYQFCDRYPQGDKTMQIVAREGETLLVVSFRVKNNSAGKKKVDLLKNGIEYPLTIDGNQYYPGISILKNGGLNHLRTTLDKGKSENAVLIYTLSKERKKASRISLTVEDKKANRQADIQLK